MAFSFAKNTKKFTQTKENVVKYVKDCVENRFKKGKAEEAVGSLKIKGKITS